MVEFNYSLKRTARRSISVKIIDGNQVVVTAPKRTSISEIENFLNSKSAWIKRHIAKNLKDREFLGGVTSYKTLLICGSEVAFEIGECDSFSEDLVRVKNVKRLKKLLCDNLGSAFLKEFKEISQLSRLNPRSVSFKNYKSRWGCCDRNANIIFNYKLLMLPVGLWRYVILHELCHTVYMNHSPAFYALLSSFMPEYKQKQRDLKRYSAVARLY